MAKRITTCKKEVENILTKMNKSEQVTYNPYDENGNTFVRIADQNGSFRCDYPERFEDELRKRAGSIDRYLTRCGRKMEGGIKTQEAILFVMNHKDDAKGAVVMYNKRRSWRDPYNIVINGRKELGMVNFSQADLDYALNCVRIG